MQSMRRLVSILLLCNFASSTCQADPHFKEKYQQLINQALPNANIGIIIQDPNSQKILFEERSKEYFYPASNTKILTAIAALKFFGPNFQYQTSLHASLDKIQDNVLNDNLYIIFRGDPTLVTADIFDMLSDLKKKGITQIAGNIVIDDRSFEEPAYAPGWTWDSIPWYYSAPITSVILNENKVRYKIEKPQALYERLNIVQNDKNVPLLKFKADVTGVSFEESENSCRLNAKVKNNDIELSGCWPIEKTPTIIELALDNPRKLAADLITHDLKKLSIKVSGKIQFSKVPMHIPAIAIKRSPPLKLLLSKVLADSNNIYAESLTKALGLMYLGEGSFQTGTRAIQGVLSKDTQIDFSKLPLSDGSGQSRYNLISPYMLMQLLHHMYHDPLFEAFYYSLSVNGKSGTLANRMNTKPFHGKVVAKTGSATGSSALSGYFTANNGKEYVFSVIINHSDRNAYALKAFEDKLCQLMIEESWES